MKLEAYIDDVRKIVLYHESIDMSKVKVLKDSKAIDITMEENNFNRAFVYLNENIDFKARYSFLYEDRHYPIKWRHVVSTKYFDEYFKVDLNLLGSHYSRNETTFRCWAPLALELKLLINDRKYPMIEVSNGLWEVKIASNLDGAHYLYEINRDGEIALTIDPFNYSSGPNAKYSTVIDLDKCLKDRIKPNLKLDSLTQAIIYEASVRDMTSFKGIDVENRSKFKGLAQRGVYYDGYITGIPYIKDLGITHIQLMPVFDFGRIDEEKPKGYNWGYDPIQYSAAEGSYITDIYDPYKRITELQELINYIHENDLYCIFDVVFNHVFLQEDFALNKLLPYYFFRYSDETNLSNGSFCGNEIRTESYFMREYIKLMVKRYIELYDVDGLRYDIMGLIDIDTINEVKDMALSLKENFIMYGEGWDMPSSLSRDNRAIMDNYAKYLGVGYFDGFFRDEVRGNVFGAQYPGYVLGDLNRKFSAARALCNKDIEPLSRINFVECHDNATFYDFMKKFRPTSNEYDDRLRIKLSLAFVLLAQGIPFLHAGEEFARTKKGDENSYISSDDINMIDYSRRSRYIDIVNFTKDMIKIRNHYPCLRLDNLEDIRSMGNVTFFDDLLVYDIANLKIIINPTEVNMHYYLQSYYMAKYEKDHMSNTMMNEGWITVERLSLLILEKV